MKKNILLIAVSIIVFLVFYYFMHSNIGIGRDSVTYLELASNITHGQGYGIKVSNSKFSYMTHFPPLYSVSLAIIQNFGEDKLLLNILLNCLLLSISAIIFFEIVFSFTQNLFISCIGSLAIVLSRPLLFTFSWISSEPLFVPLCFVSFFCFYKFLLHQSTKHLFLSGLLLSGATLTRYAAVSFLIAFLFCIIIQEKPSFKKLSRSFLVLLISFSIPLGAWFLRNIIVANTATNRHIVFHPINREMLEKGFNVVWKSIYPTMDAYFYKIPGFWRNPFEIKSLFVILFFIFIFIALILAKKLLLINQPQDSKTSYRDNTLFKKLLIVKLSIVNIFTYLLFIFLMKILVDADIPFNMRMLMPLQPLIILAFIASCSIIPFALRKKFAQKVYLGIVVIYSFSIIFDGFSWGLTRHTQGPEWGFTSSRFINSKLLKSATQINKYALIFSNEPGAVYTILGREAWGLPIKEFPTTLEQNKNFSAELLAIEKYRENNEIVFIIFDPTLDKYYTKYTTAEDIMHSLHAHYINKVDDGVIIKLD